MLASKAGKAWARGVLGEANIRRWTRLYEAYRDNGCIFHTKPKNFGKVETYQKPIFSFAVRKYEWKPIVLPRFTSIFLRPFNPYFMTFSFTLPVQHLGPPRAKRLLVPAIFWPYELEDDFEVIHEHIYCDKQPIYGVSAETKSAWRSSLRASAQARERTLGAAKRNSINTRRNPQGPIGLTSVRQGHLPCR